VGWKRYGDRRGVTAAAMIIKDPVQRQMAYEDKNADIANRL
jgi:uncharacterized Ntn-hydrolase superfamily protein